MNSNIVHYDLEPPKKRARAKGRFFQCYQLQSTSEASILDVPRFETGILREFYDIQMARALS